MSPSGSCGVKETLCSSDGDEDMEEGRTSVLSGSVSDSPTGTDKGLVGNTLCVSETELCVSLVSAGGALVSVASVACGQRV